MWDTNGDECACGFRVVTRVRAKVSFEGGVEGQAGVVSRAASSATPGGAANARARSFERGRARRR